MTAGTRLGLVEILGDPVRLDQMLDDMLVLKALYRRFRRDLPPKPAATPAPPPSVIAATEPPKPRLAPAADPAGLLIRKSDRRGGWTYQLVPGARLNGEDDAALKAGRLTTHPVDADLLAAGVDAARAAVYGAEPEPGSRPITLPSPSSQPPGVTS